jgi:hypothetical protein
VLGNLVVFSHWGVIETAASETAASAKATTAASTETTAASTKATTAAVISAASAKATALGVIPERSSWSTLHKGPHWSGNTFSLKASTLVSLGSELYRFTFLRK